MLKGEGAMTTTYYVQTTHRRYGFSEVIPESAWTTRHTCKTPRGAIRCYQKKQSWCVGHIRIIDDAGLVYRPEYDGDGKHWVTNWQLAPQYLAKP